MAKTESTAVNALIDLVGNKPVDLGDDGSDEMFRDPFARPPAKPTPAPAPAPQLQAQPVPVAMRGTQEVTPLPQQRAAMGTQTNLVPPPVRVVTAPRPTTIPPAIPGIAPPQQASRPGKPTLPPPRTTSSPNLRPPEGTPQPELFSRSGNTLPPPIRTRPPIGSPVTTTLEGSPAPMPVLPQPVAMPPMIPQPPIVGRPAPTYPAAKADITNTDGWFEATREAGKVEVVDDSWGGTMPVPRQSVGGTLRRYWLPATILAAGAIAVGAYFAVVTGHHATPTDAPALAAATVPGLSAAPIPAAATPTTPRAAAIVPAAPQADVAPALAPTATAIVAPTAAPLPATADPAPTATAPTAAAVAPAMTPAAAAVVAPAAPHVVNVRFESQPAGATVMLVDGGKTSFLGSAPVDAAVDTSRGYDVVFTLEGHPTQVHHLDPNATQRMSIDLNAAAPAVAIAAPPAAPAHHLVAVAAPAPSPAPMPAAPVHHQHLASPTTEHAPVEHAHAQHEAAAAAVPAGKGTLMISSKPPCDIVIDGRPTHLSTPQRAIPLTPGPHKITLVNIDKDLTKTINVSISAGQPTKVIQNFLH